MLAGENAAFWRVYSKPFCLFYSTAVVTKARETIEPEVMTQIVTKAKEMGRLTTCKETFYNFFFSSIRISDVLMSCFSSSVSVHTKNQLLKILKIISWSFSDLKMSWYDFLVRAEDYVWMTWLWDFKWLASMPTPNLANALSQPNFSENTHSFEKGP